MSHKSFPALLCACILAGIGILPAGTEQLRFEYEQDEKYRIVTVVDENVYINGSFSHRANILNKIAVETLSVKGSSGLLSCTFQTSERAYGGQSSFSLTENYHSLFWRDELGLYDIGPDYFMPVVRNVPLFPVEDIEPGSTWMAEGEEVHDLRRSYGIDRAFSFPVRVYYSYLRNENRDGKKIAVIEINYTVFHRVEGGYRSSGPVPVKITGVSEQVYYWDIEGGKPHSYEESFDFIFHLSGGGFVEYEGNARGSVIESPKLDKERMVEELKRELERRGIEDTSVKSEENGVTLTLDNIRFPPNSPLLLEAEKEKLRRIAAILKRYPERDFLVTGHTARIGTEESSQVLSEQRAKAVGDFLLELGVLKETQLMTRGMGSRQPLADNATEGGRRLNRRVEITILEN